MPFPKGRGQARQLGGIEGLLPPPPRVHAVEKKWGILLKKLYIRVKLIFDFYFKVVQIRGENRFFGGFSCEIPQMPPPPLKNYS